MQDRVEPWARVWVEETAKRPAGPEPIHIVAAVAGVAAILVVILGALGVL